MEYICSFISYTVSLFVSDSTIMYPNIFPPFKYPYFTASL